MKILGWVHRKFWQNSHGPQGEIATRPTFNCLTVRPLADDRHQYFVPLVKEKGKLRMMFRDPPEAPLLHEGLLAIGTFGSPVISLAEEKQKAAVEEMAEKETEEATEKDLMAVSAELKKVLPGESEKEKCSGDGNSPVPKGSGGKGSEASALVAERWRRERRVSLGELFMRSRIEEVGGDMGEEEAITEGMNVMTKKMLKRLRSVRGNAGGTCDAAEASKFRKILRIFPRKIHPENATSSKKLLKPSKYEGREMFCLTDNCSKKLNAKGNKKEVEPKEFKREGISKFKCHSYPQSSKGLYRVNSNENHEHWIKTDADYLVLEL